MITEQEKELYRSRLEAEKKKLLEEIEKNSTPADFGSDVDSFDEEADEAEEFQNELAIASALKIRVNEIDAALGRLNDGSFGVCESCGKDIENEVLAVDPESRFCASCKTKEAE